MSVAAKDNQTPRASVRVGDTTTAPASFFEIRDAIDPAVRLPRSYRLYRSFGECPRSRRLYRSFGECPRSRVSSFTTSVLVHECPRSRPRSRISATQDKAERAFNQQFADVRAGKLSGLDLDTLSRELGETCAVVENEWLPRLNRPEFRGGSKP